MFQAIRLLIVVLDSNTICQTNGIKIVILMDILSMNLKFNQLILEQEEMKAKIKILVESRAGTGDLTNQKFGYKYRDRANGSPFAKGFLLTGGVMTYLTLYFSLNDIFFSHKNKPRAATVMEQLIPSSGF
ncbi:hypothetical protein C7212DRAFT_364455 [Tuber magnatum]|uniref:Uncharacterized protein n=1 Tax=Tuber magnatum TaxID=42249 RepID=A0A317SP54_9PEZI|nr:hypothetical protein C7212DRAFT_364455 [Tuber magnatum]